MIDTCTTIGIGGTLASIAVCVAGTCPSFTANSTPVCLTRTAWRHTTIFNTLNAVICRWAITAFSFRITRSSPLATIMFLPPLVTSASTKIIAESMFLACNALLSAWAYTTCAGWVAVVLIKRRAIISTPMLVTRAIGRIIIWLDHMCVDYAC